ncbi:MAG: aldo/keto reductase [Cellvibrionaceae bacterium]
MSSNSDYLLPKIYFGSTDIRISRLGLGTVKLGRNQGVKYPTHFDLPSDEQADNLIAQAKDFGINLIDTAPAYGTSEKRLGKLLKESREDWVICSKAGEEFIDGESHYDFTPEHIRFSVERSLTRLNTDRIDIVLIHSDGNDLDIIRSGALDILEDLKQQGKIRAFGMSTKTIEGGILAAKKSDGVMVTYNLNHREESPILDFCKKENRGVLLKKVFASGHITKDESSDPLQDSMNFIFSHAVNSCAVIGTLNPDHLKQNVIAANKALGKK